MTTHGGVCSKCKRNLPAYAFTQRKAAACTVRNKAGESVTYRYAHPRGRSYVCKDCESERMRIYRNGRPTPKRRCCSNGCRRWAKWHNPSEAKSWRACELHKLPGDEPIAKPQTAYERQQSACTPCPLG